MTKHSVILTLTSIAGILLLAAILPGAHATYGNTAQWQVGFSGSCNVPTTCGPPTGGTGTFGFWGWCEFGGSSGSTDVGTTGTSGDCQVTHYDRTNLGEPNNPTHLSIDVTGWKIVSSRMSPTGVGFQITEFTLDCTGPGASLPPTPFGGCALPPGGDTGIPPVTGHYAFSPPFNPDFNINIQVNQLA